MRKAIATISMDPLISERCQIIRDEKERLEERFKFLRKQAKDAGEKMGETCREHWVAIEDRLKELGLLPPDFSKETYSLCFDSESNVIFIEDGQSGDLPPFLKKLMDE
jgi:hypothetical protein